MDQGVAAVIGAIIGLIGGFVVAGLNYRQKADELFFKALDYLGGGSQKRNLGISAIELYWDKRRHRDICISLLSGSAIYLLRASKQGNAPHELFNLDRIMNLLLSQSVLDSTQKSHYLRVREAVDEALKAASNRTDTSVGLDVDSKLLSDWKEHLDKLI